MTTTVQRTLEWNGSALDGLRRHRDTRQHIPHPDDGRALFHFMLKTCRILYGGALGGLPPRNREALHPSVPLRGVVYFSWDSDSGGPMQIRRAHPWWADFFASSQVVPGWGIHAHLRDHALSSADAPKVHLLNNVNSCPSFLPYHLEAQRILYTSILIVPVVYLSEGATPEFLGCFGLYLLNEAALPRDRAALDEGLLDYAEIVAGMVHQHEKEWRLDKRSENTRTLAGCWYHHIEDRHRGQGNADLPYLKELHLECDPDRFADDHLLVRKLSKRIRAQLSGERFLIKVGAHRGPGSGCEAEGWEKLLVAIPPDLENADGRWDELRGRIHRLIQEEGAGDHIRFVLGRPSRPAQPLRRA